MNKYIKADKAIKAIMEMQDCYNGFSDTYDKAAIIGTLEEVPAENVQPVRFGRWIDAECYSEGCDDGYICSECRRITYRTMTPFCPNCGARMRMTRK